MNSRRMRWNRTDDDFPIRDATLLAAVDRGEMPAYLLGEGDRPDAFGAPRIAIVGTRAATPMGIADAHELGVFCARGGITVVSGLAIGIDAAAHEGALDGGGLTVGVVATGLDRVYPRRHERLYERVRTQGVIVSENEDGIAPLPWRFPIRNRIIAALADAVVVVEATLNGGALHTAKYALDFGREVYALPGSRRSAVAAGTNALISDGAKMLLDPADLLSAVGRGVAMPIGWNQPARKPANADEKRVLHAFGGDGATIEEISERCSLPGDRLGAALRGLERSGLLTRRRGCWWPR